ncbi:MAG TPA: 2-isopropylmalate synthase [Vicinamibacterales bacterium]|jgi:2-isopropylmalate synthase
MTKTRVTVFDTTLRDGEQAPGFSMDAGEKVRLARQLDALGVDVIEAGFPIASVGDASAVRDVAAAVRRPVIAALARARAEDIHCAWDALRGAARPRLHVFLATSDIHLQHKLRMDRPACLALAVDSVALARTLCDDVEFSAEDASRTDPAFLEEVAEAAVEAGASTVNLPDTVGYATPDEIRAMVHGVRKRVGAAAAISTHCHDDLGLAVANSLAAIDAGAAQVECTINGIGERAGNAALEEIVMALRVRGDHLCADTGIDARGLYAASRLLSDIVRIAVPPNKAIVGDNAFAHEAGVHQDGMLKHRATYEILDPAAVGAPGSRLVIGKHSGVRGIDARCRALGYRLRPDELRGVYSRLIDLADRLKTLDDERLATVIADVCQRTEVSSCS